MLHPPRRLFIGLIPDRKVQGAIQRHCRDWHFPATAQPVRFGRYQLALHFLGDVGAAPEHALRQALRHIAMQPLELELGTPQLWRGGIAVLLPQAHQGLDRLHAQIAAALPAAGLKAEAEFHPHITLARDVPEVAAPPGPFIRWRVHEFLLLWSLQPPQAKPARDEVLERFSGPGHQAPAASGQAGEQFPLFL